MNSSLDQIYTFIEEQLDLWPLAKRNYDALSKVERRTLKVGDFPMAIQFNPARIVSTGASVSNGRPADRPCFLCKKNRPVEQLKIDILPDWELLVNPYPIFPVHLTIVSAKHQPQAAIPAEIVTLAEKLPGMVVFFNGAKAGASAPDHLHLQAVLKEELPLIRIVEENHKSTDSEVISSDSFGLHLPFLFYSGLAKDDANLRKTLLSGLNIGGPDSEGFLFDYTKVNTFFWIDNESNLRFISIPRKAHRPQCYFDEGEKHHLISPGCVDMAGVMIAPLEKDFRYLSEEDIIQIYSEVALTL